MRFRRLSRPMPVSEGRGGGGGYALRSHRLRPEQRPFQTVSENLELLAVILRSQEMPALNRQQIQRVIRANRAFKLYRKYQADLDDSDDDTGPDNDDAWLFEDLSVLLKLMVKKKEKEGFLALIFEGTTAELLKDIITIFYSPLAQVYKAASIADSLGDLQSFINDLIKTVEAVEEGESLI